MASPLHSCAPKSLCYEFSIYYQNSTPRTTASPLVTLRRTAAAGALGLTAVLSHATHAVPWLHDALGHGFAAALMSPTAQFAIATLALAGPGRQMIVDGFKVQSLSQPALYRLVVVVVVSSCELSVPCQQENELVCPSCFPKRCLVTHRNRLLVEYGMRMHGIC